MNFIDELFDEALENGMNKRTASRLLNMIKTLIEKNKYPTLQAHDWQDFIYEIIDDGYGFRETNPEADKRYLTRKLKDFLEELNDSRNFPTR